MGWTGAAIPEEYGGAGPGHLELCVLAEELGRALAPVPFSSSVYLAGRGDHAGGSEAQKKAWLPKLAAGEVIGTLALAEGPGQGRRPQAAHDLPQRHAERREAAGARRRHRRRRHRRRRRASAAPRSPRRPRRRRASRARAVETLDPTRSHARLVFNGAPAEPLGAAGDGEAPAAARAGPRRRAVGLRAGRRRRSAASRWRATMRSSATPSAGRSARSRRSSTSWPTSTSRPSWRAPTPITAPGRSTRNAPELPLAAAAARIAATEAFLLAAKENIQTHGGIGFTWEFDCHLYYRRAKLLAPGARRSRVWKDRLVSQLETRQRAAVSGGDRMDFNDTPEEAAFRAGARAFLDKNAKRREPGAGMRLSRRQRGPRVRAARPRPGRPRRPTPATPASPGRRSGAGAAARRSSR